MVERITRNFSLRDSGSVVFVVGNVTDLFITPDLILHSLDRFLWLYLKKKGFERVVFFDSSKRIRYFDKESFELRKGRSNKVVNSKSFKVGNNYKSKLKGVLGPKSSFLNKNEPNESDDDSKQEATASNGVRISSEVKKSDKAPYSIALRDTNAIASIDFQLREDKIKTAVIFSQIDQHYFTSELARNEFRNRIRDWNLLNNQNKLFLVFQTPEISRKVNGNTIWHEFLQQFPILQNIIQKNKNSLLKVDFPATDELVRMFNRLRLFERVGIDWVNLDRIIKGALRKNQILSKWNNVFLDQIRKNKEGLTYDLLVDNEIISKTFTDEEEAQLDEELLKKNLEVIRCQEDNTILVFSGIKGFFGKKKKSKPLVYYLVGTSGTGKTFTVKQVAKSLKNNGFNYVYLSMPEFQQEHTVSKIIGSPPGYVGSSESPLLLNELKKSEKLVICFDEIEKAHPNILTALMQLLEEGKMTFNVGGNSIQADFSHCIIFFTSNAEMLKLLKLKEQFQTNGIGADDIKFQKKVAKVLTTAKAIKNEVTGRVDKFLVYNPLTSDAVMDIVVQELNSLQEGINFKNISPRLLANVAFETSGSLTGARDIKKMLESKFLSRLGELEVGIYDLIEEKEDYIIKKSDGNENKDAKGIAKSLLEEIEYEARMIDFSKTEKRMKEAVQNQDENIEQIIQKLNAWYPIIKKQRPLSFFMVGTSGTGKTYTAKKLTENLKEFDFADELVYFDMNDFKSTDDRNRLIGSPIGFQGSENKPRIFEALDNSPKGKLIILFDEIEKAHPDILTGLMQLLDEGIMRWSKGFGDFRKCIVFFTSNAMMEELTEMKKSWTKKGMDFTGRDFENKVKSILIENKIIRPEVTGRISKFLVYNPLGIKYTIKIAYQEICLLAKSYGIEKVKYVSPSILSEIAKKSAGHNTGTREVKNYIEELIGEQLIKHLKENPKEINEISIIDSGYEEEYKSTE